jgi:hypothetical protein
MKLLHYTTFKVTVSSAKGSLMQEIIVKANTFEDALNIGNQYAESLGGEVSGVKKSYYTCVEQSTKTITVDL